MWFSYLSFPLNHQSKMTGIWCIFKFLWRSVNFLVYNSLDMFYISAVIQALLALVQDPEPEHPLRADLAEEYTKDKKKFLKNAEEYTKKHAEKRPSD